MTPACPYCHDTGWTALATPDGDAYIIACPNGCPTTQGAA